MVLLIRIVKAADALGTGVESAVINARLFVNMEHQIHCALNATALVAGVEENVQLAT